MVKRFIPQLLMVTGAVAVNILSTGLDLQFHLSTSARLALVGGFVMLVIVLTVLLEGGVKIPGYFAYHRYCYVADMQRAGALRQWINRFASLQLGTRPRYVSAAEVQDGVTRRDLVEVLMNQLLRKRQPGRVLILGEPGSGKSTAMERLTLELALISYRRFGFGPFPILIRAGTRRADNSLASVIAEGIGEWARGKTRKLLSEPEVIRRIIEQRSLVLFVDAIDELTGSLRDSLVSTLSSLTNSGALEHISVVVTCRTRQDPRQALPGYESYSLLELSDESVATFIGIYGQGSHSTLQEMHSRFWESGFLDRGGLARNPFWLKQLISIGTQHHTRSGILRDAAREALARELSKPQMALRDWARPVNATDDQIVDLCLCALSRMAFQMDLGRAIPRNTARRWLSEWLDDPDGAPAQLALSADHILNLSTDAGLIDRSFDPIAFAHRLLQEYFTAAALHSERRTYDAWLPAFVADTTRWQTLSLFTGLLAAPDRGQFVERLLGSPSTPRSVACAIAAFIGDNRIPRGLMAIKLLEEVRKGLSDAPCMEGELLESLREFLNIGHELAAGFLGCLLADRDEQVRMRVCELLAFSSSREAARLLASAGLEDTSEGVARAASGALTRSGEQGLWQTIRCLSSRQSVVRLRATRTLAQMADASALNYLLRMSTSEPAGLSSLTSYYVRDTEADEEEAICEALVICGRQRPGRLLLAMAFGDTVQRRRVLKALQRIGEPGALPVIQQCLGDMDEGVRDAALNLLKGENGGTACLIAGLRKVLAVPLHSHWAAKALANIDGSEGVEVLVSTALADSREYVREAAAKALETVTGESTIRELAGRLGAIDTQTDALVSVLAANPEITVDLVLAEMAEDPKPKRRAAVIRCLGNRGLRNNAPDPFDYGTSAAPWRDQVPATALPASPPLEANGG